MKKANIENGGSIQQQDVDFSGPDGSPITKMSKRTKKILDQSEKCGKRIDDRMIEKQKNEVFEKGDMVLVRLGGP